MQMDMFDPAHIAYRKEAEAYRELAAPYLKKASDAEAKARELCPHENIEDEYIFHDDEYGRSMESWTEIKVWCPFCKRTEYINRDAFKKSGLSLMDVLLGKGRDLK